MNAVARKTFYFLLTLIFIPLIAGLYGVLHDQFTYTISPEYFTLFKFFQFGLYGWNSALHMPERVAVAIVGWRATWWTGVFIGPFLAGAGLIHKDARVMLRANFAAVGITLAVALITGLIGLLYGWAVLSVSGVDWLFPPGLVGVKQFIMVGSMHNFSYAGGMIGMFAGIAYHIYRKRKEIV